MTGEGLTYEKFLQGLRSKKDFQAYMLGSVLVLAKPIWGIESPVMYEYLRQTTRHFLGVGPMPSVPEGANVKGPSDPGDVAQGNGGHTLWTPGGEVNV